MNQYLVNKLQHWQILGGRPEAEFLPGRTGWLLRLNFRIWLCTIVFCLVFCAVFVLILAAPGAARQPLPRYLFALVSASVIAPFACSCVVFVALYRVELDEEGLTLCRLLVRKQHVCWIDVVGFDYEPGDHLLKVHSADGTKISLYLSLNGLSAIRRCLATLTPRESLIASWVLTDVDLMTDVPAWRCAEQDLTGNPFDPLTRDDTARPA